MTEGQSDFAMLLHRFRVSAGLTQEDLAERSGLSPRGISDLERGRRTRPYSHTVAALATALSLDRDERELLRSAAAGGPAVEPASLGRFRFPPVLPSLTGRDEDVGAATRLLMRREGRLVTLSGPGGVGKTQLAIAVAHSAGGSFRDGMVFVDLAPLAADSSVVATAARAVGLQQGRVAPAEELLIEYLAGRELLLLLDNFEHLLGAAPAIARILSACPALRVLVTSRVSLRVGGEQLFAARPLAHPDIGHLPGLTTLRQYPAVSLFVQRVQALDREFALTDANARPVAAICAGVEGLPLAIELAASRMRMLGASALAARLDEPLRVLTAGRRDAPARQRTLRDTIAWSYSLLSSEEQRLLRNLSLFAGGWTLTAAERLCGRDLEIVEGLAALVDSSLVQAENADDPDGGPGRRFSMLVVVREFCLEQLAQHGEEADGRERHALLFSAIAGECEHAFRTRAFAEWRLHYPPELDNFRSALRWAVANQRAEVAQRMAGDLFLTFEYLGLQRELRDWAETALLIPAELDNLGAVARTQALNAAGSCAWHLAEFEHAERRLKESAELALDHGYLLGYAAAQRDRGISCLSRGDLASGRELLETALAVSEQLDEPWSIAFCAFILGDVVVSSDEARAEALYLRSLDIFEGLENPWGMGTALTGIGGLALRRGEFELAREAFMRSLTMRREVGHEWGAAISIASLAELDLAVGDGDSARAWAAEAVALFERAGDLQRLDWARRLLHDATAEPDDS